MAFNTHHTTRIQVPGHGTIKITPVGGRKYEIKAPRSLEITEDKRSRKTYTQRRRLTRRRKRA